MSAVDLAHPYARQKVFAPASFDGKFWNLWIWAVIPLAVAWSVRSHAWSTVSWWAVALAYYTQMIGVTLGFHRYFAHGSYKTSRALQLVLCVLGVWSGQTGPISWELIHRDHHRNCEVEGDPHSIHGGFWYAHGWFLWSYPARRTDFTRSRWGRFPEIVFFERWAPGFYYLFGFAIAAATGFRGAVWYWLVPTFLSWNVTMLINSWAHTWGGYDYRDFHQADACKARNLGWAWPLLLGDNWHNNHHAYPNSALQGMTRWQIDPMGLLLLALRRAGLVWDLIEPSEKVLSKSLVRTDRPDA